MSSLSNLTTAGHTLDFFEATRLIETLCGTSIEHGAIKFTADPRLSFPAGDIAAIKQNHPDKWEIIVTFMGLAGASSPLPVYFSDYINSHGDQAAALTDFLHIFNHRLYTLFYRAARRFSWTTASSPGPVLRMVMRLCGYIGPQTPLAPDVRMAAYSSLFAGQSRSAAGLGALLGDYFNGMPVTIKEFVPRWVTIDNCPRIGADAQLGINALAGTQVRDVSGAFRICLGPLSRSTFEQFLPGSKNLDELKKIVKKYCSEPLDYEVEIILEPQALTPVILGADTAVLGQSASLGKTDEQADEYRIIVI